MIADAVISPCQQYRYSLTRQWNADLPTLMFIGLNPSTADATNDDPTLRRCIGFAKSWGYGGVIMANLFAYRATKPTDMKAAPDPIGIDNDQWLLTLANQSQLIVAAWGNHGSFLERSSAVKQLIGDLHYLSLNGSGEPKHPLYIKANTQPTQW